MCRGELKFELQKLNFSNFVSNIKIFNFFRTKNLTSATLLLLHIIGKKKKRKKLQEILNKSIMAVCSDFAIVRRSAQDTLALLNTR